MSRILKWGIVGAGDIARKISAKAMKDAEGSELVAIMRTNSDRAREFATEFDVPKHYVSAEELIEDQDVNVIYLATPVYLHHVHTLLAARAGKHVLVEKPMALDEAECNEMIEACEKYGVQLMVLFYQRFNRLHQKLKELLSEGLLGQITAARSSFTQLSAAGPLAPKWEWRLDPKKGGGGTLMDTGSHCVDTLRYVLGREVVKVGALSDTILFDYPVDDTTSVLLEFEDGIQSVITSYWSSPDWDQATVNSLEIYGEKGYAVTSPVNNKFSHGDLRWNIGDGLQRFNADQNTHVSAIEAFRTSIEEKSQPPVTGMDGLINIKIMSAIYQSARQGGFISL